MENEIEIDENLFFLNYLLMDLEFYNFDNEIKNLDILAENDFFVLYNGVEIPKKTGRVDLSDIESYKIIFRYK